jgi:hypothetical protein
MTAVLPNLAYQSFYWALARLSAHLTNAARSSLLTPLGSR